MDSGGPNSIPPWVPLKTLSDLGRDYCLGDLIVSGAMDVGGLTVRSRVAADLPPLPPNCRAVSLTARLPKRMASRVLGVQISMRLPRTAPPVSATKYSPR